MDVGNPTATQGWQYELTAHALAYGVLSRVFYDEPDEDFVRELANGGVADEWPVGDGNGHVHAGLALLRESLSPWGRETAQALRIDYNRLFLGAGGVPVTPWESVYLSNEHLLFEEQTLAVRRCYSRFGLEAPRLHQEPDDHLGLELAFMLHLCVLALDALEHGDASRFEELIDAQRSFLTDHLLRWAPLCLNRVIEYAGTDYYRGAAHLALGTLAEAASALGLEDVDRLVVEA